MKELLDFDTTPMTPDSVGLNNHIAKLHRDFTEGELASIVAGETTSKADKIAKLQRNLALWRPVGRNALPF